MVRDLGHVEVHAGATPLGGARIAPAPSSALFGFPTSSPGTPRVCAWKHRMGDVGSGTGGDAAKELWVDCIGESSTIDRSRLCFVSWCLIFLIVGSS